MTTNDKKPRRISIKGTTYVRLRKYCTHQGISISKLIEALVEDIGVKP